MESNSERIDRYIRNQMSPEESELFLNDLKKNKELLEEAKMMATLVKEMKNEQAERDVIIKQGVLSAHKRRRNIRLVLSIAAMFLLIFGATTLWNRQSDTDALFSNHYTTYNTAMLRGGDDTAIDTELSKLFNDIGTAEDVIPIITRLQTIYDNLQSGNDDYADYRDYKDDIAWYLALAYIKTDNIDRAKDILKPLADKGNSEAIKLIEEIEEM